MVKAVAGWIHKFAGVFLPLVHTVNALWAQSTQRPVVQISAQENSTLAGDCKKVFYLLPHA